MKKVIDRQNDLIELLYKAEQQVLPIAGIHGFSYDKALILQADNLRKEIMELKTELSA